MMPKAQRKYKEEAKQRQLKAILNKLSPQNFEKLFEQVKAIEIDNTGTLNGVVSQIFDSAVMEPALCEMCANFCYHLAAVLPDFSEDNEKITFKRLLLNKCQEEFERGEREQEEANKADEEGETKRSAEEREEKRLEARRRMLGNIILIGELYKKKMLTERIMHECIKKLLGEYPNPDEEDVEALCKLMSTIGETIDHPKAKEHMDAYFEMMTMLSNNMKLSSRVRFRLKDAIDLRKNKWRGMFIRGPPAIASTTVADIGPGEWKRLAPALTGLSNVSERPMYGVRDDLVPRFGPDRFTGPAAYDQLGSQERNLSHINRDPRNIDHGFDRHLAASPPSRSQGPSLIQNVPSEMVWPEERLTDMSMAAIKEFYRLPGIRISRGRRLIRSRGLVTVKASHPWPPVCLVGIEPESSSHQLSLRCQLSHHARDEKEVTLCIKDLNSSSFHPSMISLWINDSFERKDIERDLLAKLLVNLTRSRDDILTPAQLIKGFESVLTTLEDAVIDAPKAAEFLGRIFAKAVLDDVVTLGEISQLLHDGGKEPGRLLEIGLAGDVLGFTLEMIKAEKGENVLNDIRNSSNLRLEDFRPPGPNSSRKLENFMAEGSILPKIYSGSSASFNSKKSKLIRCNCGELAHLRISWTEKNPGRGFWLCPNHKVCTQKIFLWEDAEFTERAKEVINDQQMQIAMLEREVARFKERDRREINKVGHSQCVDDLVNEVTKMEMAVVDNEAKRIQELRNLKKKMAMYKLVALSFAVLFVACWLFKS